MPTRPVTLLGKTKALYEWVLGFYVIITGIVALTAMIKVGNSYLLKLPTSVENLLLVSDLVIGGILLAIWGEKATVDPIKSVSLGIALIVFSLIAMCKFSVPGLILGTVLVSIGFYLLAHGSLELVVKKS